MPILTSKIGSSIASAVIVTIVLVTLYSLKYEVPKPENWSANVTVYRRGIGGQTSVFDADSGKFLFSYEPEYDLNVHPIKIEKLDSNHWQVVFEAPNEE